MSNDLMLEAAGELDKRGQIVNAYLNLKDKLARRVRMNDLVEAGFTKDMVVHHFRNLAKLEHEARALDPDAFHDVEISNFLDERYRQTIKEELLQYRRFIVTTAISGGHVNEAFLASAQNYCSRNNAALLVMIAPDQVNGKVFGGSHGSLDKKILSTPHCFLVPEGTYLNSNIRLSMLKVPVRQVNPLSGLQRTGNRSKSTIYASPKQMLECVAVAKNKLPHALMTTGAITNPDYVSDDYAIRKSEFVANHDHVMGAIVVEVQDDNIFHYRQVQLVGEGFVDLGVRYQADGTAIAMAPAAFVLGDWHATETDPVARACWEDVVGALRPNQLLLHDAFSGVSINHHEAENRVLKAQLAAKSQISLDAELQHLADDINHLLTLVDKVVLVKSNHDEFLDRYLKTLRFETAESHNILTMLKSATAMVEHGVDPLEFNIAPKLKDTQRCVFLSRDESYQIGGIELGEHGDKGPNGSRGGLAGLEKSHDRCVVGHSHTPRIIRGAWQVGTSSSLSLAYNKGPSSWLHTSCLVYEDGSRQLINVIDGKWRLVL